MHLDTLIAMNNFASVLRAQGEFDEAEEWFRKAFGGLNQVQPGSRLVRIIQADYGGSLRGPGTL